MEPKDNSFVKNPNTVKPLESELAVLLEKKNSPELFSDQDKVRLEQLQQIAAPEFENVQIDQKLSAMGEDARVKMVRENIERNIHGDTLDNLAA
jgi:hypothetical protein